jgi:hypothetical protein
MEALVPNNYGKNGPEAKIQRAIIAMLERKGWYVKVMVGNAFQWGIPDLYATHKVFGPRWVEVKLPDMVGSRFTKAQLEHFPLICSHGHGVWVLTAATQKEYEKLKGRPNWYHYLKIMK